MAKKKKKKKPMDGLEALKAALGPAPGMKPSEPEAEEAQPQEPQPPEPPPEEPPPEEPVYEGPPPEDTEAPAVDEGPALGEEPAGPDEPEPADPPPPDIPDEIFGGPPPAEEPAPEPAPSEEESPIGAEGDEPAAPPADDHLQVGRRFEMADEMNAPETDLAGNELEPIQSGLEGIFRDQSEAAQSASGNVLDNVRKAGDILDSQYRRILDLLRSNEMMVRSASKTAESVHKRTELQGTIEEAINELNTANSGLEGNVHRLQSEREGLDNEKDRATTENDELNASIRELSEEISSLSSENESLATETADLEKQRDRLEEDVRRLTRLKEEYLANVARFREEGGG
jgi:hypothetical protein